MHAESAVRAPLIYGDKNYHQITEDICRPIEAKPTLKWFLAISFTSLVMCWGFFALFMTVWFGIGEWNLNTTVGWGWGITNFVWWIGIGHAGTLISAILLLFRQKWRMAINRSAEAMTIFAVICAAIFPVFHMGRVWVGFYNIPYPNSRGPVWPNFNSPLMWDVFAVSTYFTVSLLFWYSGMIPDLAAIRDRAKTKFTKIYYGILSFGWVGSAKHWQRHEALSLVLAGLATPLVLSVHTIVSMDFATSVIPGWHTTIFPPYFVAGAIFSGFAMVLTLMIVARKVMGLQQYITIEHIESMNKIIVLTGSIVGCAYLTELFIAWYSGNIYEQYAFSNRALGPYWWAYWSMMTCNVISPQLFWVKPLRRNVWFTFFMTIIINCGMWFERFVIIVTSLHRDYLPSAWTYYSPSWVEISILIGTMGLFLTAFLFFAKTMPIIAMAETKHILKTSGDSQKKAAEQHAAHHHGGGGALAFKATKP